MILKILNQLCIVIRFQYAYHEMQYTFEELNLSKIQIQIVNELLFNINLFNSNIIKGEESNLNIIKSLATDINILFTMLDEKTVTILKNAIAFGDITLNDYISILPELIEFMKEEKIIHIFKSLKLNRVSIILKKMKININATN